VYLIRCRIGIIISRIIIIDGDMERNPLKSVGNIMNGNKMFDNGMPDARIDHIVQRSSYMNITIMLSM